MTVGAGISVADGNLMVLGKKVLSQVPQNVVITPSSSILNWAFIGVNSDRKGSRRVFPIKKLHGLRFMCVFRFKMWWMTQRMGTSRQEVPLETQFLLVEAHKGSDIDGIRNGEEDTYAVFLPLLEGDFRAVLQGNEQNEIEICVESGCPDVEGFDGSHLVSLEEDQTLLKSL